MDQCLNTFVAKLTSRTKLTDHECQAVLALGGKSEQLEAHESFVLLGDATMSACLVLDGFCARVSRPTEESRQITAIYIKGDMPDLYSAFLPQANATLESLTRATIIRIPHLAIRQVMRVYPAVAEAFGRYLIADAAITSEWLINVGGREAARKLAHLFCEMAVRMAKVEAHSFSFFFPISQTQLAEVCALSSVHINRSLMSLRRDGLIVVDRGMITIPNWDALKKAASFDDRYLVSSRPSRFSN